MKKSKRSKKSKKSRNAFWAGLLSFVFMTLSFQAHATILNPYRYEIKNYPAEVDCHDFALELETKFKSLNQIDQAKGRCVDIGETLSFVVEYVAEIPVEVVTTDLYGSAVVSGGWFKDRASCIQGLDAAVEMFEQATELEVFTSYCYKRPSARRPWVTKIDGFGEHQLKPRVAQQIMLGSFINETEETFIRDIRTSLVRLGAKFIGPVFINYWMSYPEIGYLYYSDQIFYPKLNVISKVHNKELCLSQAELIKRTYSRHQNPPLKVSCMGAGISNLFEVIALDTNDSSDFERSAETFANFQSCEAKRPALAAFYNERYQLKAASLCSQELETTIELEKKWHVHFISES